MVGRYLLPLRAVALPLPRAGDRRGGARVGTDHPGVPVDALHDGRSNHRSADSDRDADPVAHPDPVAPGDPDRFAFGGPEPHADVAQPRPWDSVSSPPVFVA